MTIQTMPRRTIDCTDTHRTIEVTWSPAGFSAKLTTHLPAPGPLTHDDIRSTIGKRYAITTESVRIRTIQGEPQ